MRELDIGEVVKRSGVPASTLRYYEQLGLLQALGRRGLRRQYDEQVLERLALIGLGCLPTRMWWSYQAERDSAPQPATE